MCAATVDWITFSGLIFIVLLSIVLIAFLIIEFSKTVTIFTKDKMIGKRNTIKNKRTIMDAFSMGR